MPPLFSGFISDIRNNMVRPFIRGDILDIGCGVAPLASGLPPGTRYVGLERQDGFHAYLHKTYPLYTFYDVDIDKDPLPDEPPFDTILMTAILEHLKNPEFVISQLADNLKPGGRILITTPSPMGGVIHAAGAMIGLFYREAKDEHETFFTPKTLAPLLKKHGLHFHSTKTFLLGGNQLFICERQP